MHQSIFDRCSVFYADIVNHKMTAPKPAIATVVKMGCFSAFTLHIEAALNFEDGEGDQLIKNACKRTIAIG